MTALAILLAVLALIALRVNLVWALMAGALMVQFTYGAGELSYFAQDIWAAMDRQVLLAIPLFVLVGQIMARGSIASRLIRVIVAMTGHLPGGLAMATILSCAAVSPRSSARKRNMALATRHTGRCCVPRAWTLTVSRA